VCFGGFQISVDGRTVDLGELRPRALTLLRLLTLEHGTNIHRERLIEALWPGVGLDVGLRRLQVAISSVRSVLQRAGVTDLDAVRRNGDSYRLVLDDASVDVARFESLLAESRHERHRVGRRIELRSRALEFYAGDLFPEEGTVEHVADERERLRLAAADAAWELARDHSAHGDPAEAVSAARHSLRLNRYQDRAWELLADALAATGDQIAAQRTRLEHSEVRASLEGPGGTRPGQFVPPLSAR
jgi:two-component SAPR family response regulator